MHIGRQWKFYYRNGPSVWANSADPDQTASVEEQSDHGPFCLYVFGKDFARQNMEVLLPQWSEFFFFFFQTDRSGRAVWTRIGLLL